MTKTRKKDSDICEFDVPYLDYLGRKLDPIYKEIKGGYFGMVASLIFFLSVAICSLLYHSIEPFTITSHWISNLGATETNSGMPNDACHFIFSISFIIVGVFLFLFTISIIRLLLSGSQECPIFVLFFFIWSVITSLGLIVVAIWDIKSSPFLHGVGAILFFFGSLFMTLLFGVSAHKNNDVSELQVMMSIACAITQIIFLITLIPPLTTSSNMMLVITDTTTKMNVSRVWEWISVFSFFGWVGEVSIYAFFSNS